MSLPERLHGRRQELYRYFYYFSFLALFSLLCWFAFHVRAATLALDIIAERFYIHCYSSKLLQTDLAQLFWFYV